MMSAVIRLILSGGFLLVVVTPAWWLAGRIQEGKARPFFQLLCGIGLALVGYVSGVNLLGRLLGNSIAAVLIYLAASAVGAVLLWRKWPADVRIDLVSTGLWLFVFLFIYFWLRELKFGRLPATWGSFAVLLGGGLSWLYLGRLESYDGISKVPAASELTHRYDAAKSWIDNLIAASHVPSMHLRNSDGSLSNLPWDTAALFQQHPVSLGIALTLVALYLFVSWQRRTKFHVALLVVNIVTFGVLFLAHAVFGGVAAVTASLCLLGGWLQQL